jgi:hypothetical protein
MNLKIEDEVEEVVDDIGDQLGKPAKAAKVGKGWLITSWGRSGWEEPRLAAPKTSAASGEPLTKNQLSEI